MNLPIIFNINLNEEQIKTLIKEALYRQYPEMTIKSVKISTMPEPVATIELEKTKVVSMSYRD